MGVQDHFYIWWTNLLAWGYETIFSPYGGTHNEAPKRKSVASLALKNAYLWLCWPFSMRGYETIFLYGGSIFWQQFVRTF